MQPGAVAPAMPGLHLANMTASVFAAADRRQRRVGIGPGRRERWGRVVAGMLRTLAACLTFPGFWPRSTVVSSSSLPRSPRSSALRRRSTGHGASADRRLAPPTRGPHARLLARDVLAGCPHRCPPSRPPPAHHPSQSCPCLRAGARRPRSARELRRRRPMGRGGERAWRLGPRRSSGCWPTPPRG